MTNIRRDSRQKWRKRLKTEEQRETDIQNDTWQKKPT